MDASENILALPAGTADGRARRRALAGLADTSTPLVSVSYRSDGAVLIIGSADAAAYAEERLGDVLRCTVLITSDVDDTAPAIAAGGRVFRAPLARLEGYLGRFRAEIEHQGAPHNLAALVESGRSHFDLVLDLDRRPWIRREIPPPGYYAPGNDPEAFDSAVAELRDLIGEFEKPRYFAYDPDICAHGRSGLSGCTRCLDSCPTEAIASLGERVEVDAFLCQGGGSCATACPSGAISYAYPPVADLLRGVSALLRDFHEAGGSDAIVLFHDREQGHAAVVAAAASLPEQVLPVAVEEIGSVGMDTWLATLAYGAARVWLLTHAQVAPSVRHEIDRQLEVAGALLEELGAARDRVGVWSGEADPPAILGASPVRGEPAGFAPVGGKRAILRFAIDHLYRQSGVGVASAPLPSHASFGTVVVDREACTLCMACVSVCPSGALEAGGDSPRLGFIEWNCVQCGLCETACPENAVTRHARFLFDADERMRTRTLNEESPFCCIRCGKPFATRSVMERMREKLENHPMFQQPGALQRIQMCDDCRVKDMFVAEGGLGGFEER